MLQVLLCVSVLDALDEHITNDEDRKIALRRKKTVEEIFSSEESYLVQLEKLIKVSRLYYLLSLSK